jgi:hypothetical protein
MYICFQSINNISTAKLVMQIAEAGFISLESTGSVVTISLHYILSVGVNDLVYNFVVV